MSKRYLFTAVIFVVWVVGFYLASNLGEKNLIETIVETPIESVLLGLGFYILAIGTGILILYRNLRHVGLKPPIKGVSKAWIFGSFIDNVAPTVTPVGEASMAYFLEKFYRISYTKSLAAIGMYVSAWGISVSLFALLAVILAQVMVGIPPQYFILVVAVVIIFSAITTSWLLLLTKKSLVEKLVGKVIRIYNTLYNKLKRKKVTFDQCVYCIAFDQSYASLELVMKNKIHVLTSVILFIIPQLGHVFCLFFMMTGLGATISFYEVLMIHIVASVVGLISLIPSGLFVYETVVKASAESVGVPGEIALAAVMLYRLIFVWITNLIGGMVGIIEGIEDAKVGPA